MTSNPLERRRIAARARGLGERLHTPVDGPEFRDREGDEWLARWRERVAGDDPTAFERRLDLAGETTDVCRRRLHGRTLPEDEPCPAWVDTLDELVGYVESREADDPPLVEAADDVPFVDVLAWFVAFASAGVDRDGALSERARSKLERWLLDRLSWLSAHTLFIEFKTFLADHDRELAFADDPEMPDSPRRYYDRFVAELREGGLRSLFAEYATLGRLVVSLVEQWRAAVGTFHSRLRADRDALAETFGSGDRLGRVVDLDHRGDPHQGGQVAFRVAFESGVELAYKPRDVRPEARFADLVSWVNAESDCPDLAAPECLPREGYGWMAWADPAPCPTDESVDRYFRRAGALGCLLYALNFTDGHVENLVAAGEHPVVVDLETLAQPGLPSAAAPPASERPPPRQNSILRTDLFPEDHPDADFRNGAGLDAPVAERTGVQIPTFERPNTDVIELRYEDTATVSGDNLPRLDGERVDPRDHSDSIGEGFAEAYRFLLDRRETLLADDGPLAGFADAEFRFIYRPSSAYQSVLTPLTTPECHRSGRALGCKMERLARPFAADEVDPELWPAFEAERAALWRADVPRFSVRADETTLRHDGEPVADAFDESPLERTRRRVRSLSESDLDEQLDLFELAYDSLGRSSGGDAVTDPRRVAPDAAIDLDVGRRARAIYERIRESRADPDEGSPTWYCYAGTGEGVRLTTVDDDVYGGRLGIATFCAALAAATGDSEPREFATQVASAVADGLDADTFSDLPVGVGTGIGSYAYGFAVLGELLDADEFTDAARRSATALTSERFAADDDADLMTGNAGAVIALLALYDRTGDDEFLDRATVAGEQLLADRVEVDGVRAWRTVAGERVLTGMAHGVAGIAYALARLSAATGDDRFRDAALDALGYEDAAYSTERCNWPDYRPESTTEFPVNWCTGRPGVGLARLGTYDAIGDDAVLEDGARALRATDPGRVDAFDHLCCGNFSRVAFLLEAGRALDEPRHCDAARELASATVRRADENGRFTVPKATDHWYDPSLFSGEAGIGYTLLRLDEPELPCVTLWE